MIGCEIKFTDFKVCYYEGVIVGVVSCASNCSVVLSNDYEVVKCVVFGTLEV